MLPGPKGTPYRCRGTVTPPQGRRVTVAQEWALSVDDISGNDINGDGIPKVVFDAFSGGEKCCYLYWIVSLEKKPQVLREIRNQVPLVFRKRTDGGTEIRTGEGSFDLFFLPHSEAVIPEMVLRLEGDRLVDVSSEYREEYDRQIAQLPTVKRVLTVVLNYLYSGREEQAWQALDEMWPPSDKERVQGLIMERRARGLLAHGTAAAAK